MNCENCNNAEKETVDSLKKELSRAKELIDFLNSPFDNLNTFEVRYPMGSTKMYGRDIVSNDEIAINLLNMFKRTGVFLAPSDKDEDGEYKWKLVVKSRVE